MLGWDKHRKQFSFEVHFGLVQTGQLLWWQWDGEKECGKVCKDGAEIHPRVDSTHPFFDGGDGRGGYEGQQIVVVGVHAIQFGIVDLLERVPCFVLLFGSKMFQGSGAWCFFLFFSSTTGSIPHGCFLVAVLKLWLGPWAWVALGRLSLFLKSQS